MTDSRAAQTETREQIAEHPRVLGLFTVIRELSDGLYVIDTGGDQAMWTLRKLRKDTHCAASRAQLHKGEMHYGPVGNMDYRSWRVHRDFVERQL